MYVCSSITLYVCMYVARTAASELCRLVVMLATAAGSANVEIYGVSENQDLSLRILLKLLINISFGSVYTLLKTIFQSLLITT